MGEVVWLIEKRTWLDWGLYTVPSLRDLMSIFLGLFGEKTSRHEMRDLMSLFLELFEWEGLRVWIMRWVFLLRPILNSIWERKARDAHIQFTVSVFLSRWRKWSEDIDRCWRFLEDARLAFLRRRIGRKEERRWEGCVYICRITGISTCTECPTMPNNRFDPTSVRLAPRPCIPS